MTIRRNFLKILAIAALAPLAAACHSRYVAEGNPKTLNAVCGTPVPGALLSSDRTLKVAALALSNQKWGILEADSTHILAQLAWPEKDGRKSKSRLRLCVTAPGPDSVMVVRPTGDSGISIKDGRLLKRYVEFLEDEILKTSCVPPDELERKLRDAHIWYWGN